MARTSTSTRPRFRARSGIVALLVASTVALAAGSMPAGAAVRSTNRPHVPKCTPLEEFLKSSQSQGFYGTGQTSWVYNYNTSGLSRSLTTSTTNTIGFSLQTEESVDAGVIFASADASFSQGVTYSHDDSSEQSTTVYDIPIGKYGIIQIGNQMGIVKGTYEVVNSTCQTTEKTAVTGIFPLDEPSGTAGGYNSTSSPPWPQSHVVSS